MNRTSHLQSMQDSCSAIVQSGHAAVNVKEYLLAQPSEKVIILRHDVDRKPEKALKMAEIEK